MPISSGRYAQIKSSVAVGGFAVSVEAAVSAQIPEPAEPAEPAKTSNSNNSILTYNTWNS